MKNLLKIITLIALLIVSTITFGQTGVIDIRDFKGLATNVDLEDMGDEFFQVLRNFRPYQGKLIKTFGYGSKINIASPNIFDNFQTYQENNLNNDFIYIGSHINSGNSLIPYALYNNTWIDLKNNFSGVPNFVSISTDSFYHKDDKNPIIQADGILRILPGNVGEPIANEESKGLWIGNIAREYFDDLFKPDSGFYGYRTNIDKPEFASTITIFDSGGFSTDDIKYYKYSYLYDGVQEGLLSEAI